MVKLKLKTEKFNLGSVTLSRPFTLVEEKINKSCPKCGGSVSHTEFYTCDSCSSTYKSINQLRVTYSDGRIREKISDMFIANLEIVSSDYISDYQTISKYYLTSENDDLINSLILISQKKNELVLLTWKDTYGNKEMGILDVEDSLIILKLLRHRSKVKFHPSIKYKVPDQDRLREAYIIYKNLSKREKKREDVIVAV